MTVKELLSELDTLLKDNKITEDSEVLTSSLEVPSENSELFTSCVSPGKSPHEYEDGVERKVLFINSIDRVPNKSTYKDRYVKSYGTGYESISFTSRFNKFEMALLLFTKQYYSIRKKIRQLKLDLNAYKTNMRKTCEKLRKETDKRRQKRIREAIKRKEKARIAYEKKLKKLEELRKREENLPYEIELCY